MAKINIKKFLTRLTEKSNLIYDKKTVTLSVAGNSYASAEIDVSKTGYIPLAISGFRASSGGNSYIAFYSCSINRDDNVARIGIRNNSSTARSMQIEIEVLYQKLGGVLTNLKNLLLKRRWDNEY